jgi:polysaccharide export outer membrane protein
MNRFKTHYVISFRLVFPFLFLAFSSVGCRVWNPSKIYKVKLGDLSDLQNDPDRVTYRIRPGDRLSLLIYTNNGYKLVDAGLANLSGSQGMVPTSQISYLVEGSGIARFPMIDTATVAGCTMAEAEERLEVRYEAHLVDPWVQLRVVNRRAFVYRGSDQANVVSLPNEDMTLLEVIASAGGIPATGKAYRIKLVREGPQGPILYGIDLRDGTNLHAGQTIVRANDVILIDPTFETTFVAQLTPFLAVITSGIAVYGLFRSLRP